jgi:hypothetical protein
MPAVRSAIAAEASPSRVFLIGNSLTWDTVPSRLAGDVQWHVDCGAALPYIHAHPQKPCVKDSTLWPKALADKQYDLVSVQPHYGATLAQDVETISAWMALQPKAVFVIHSGWARHKARADEFAAYAAPDQMTHGPVYLRALLAELQRKNPGREFRQTFVQNLLAQVALDIAADQAPFKNIEELYRDDIHLTLGAGRYLAHNAMRRALGQPRSDAGFEKLDPAHKKYLDGVLALLDTSAADRALLKQVLSEKTVDRSGLIAQIADAELKAKLAGLLPETERAANARPETLKLEAEINDLGGRLTCTPTGPQWLYLAVGDQGAEIFDVPSAIDLYNGNNPLKGKGGKNERVTDTWLERLAGVTTLKKLDLANCAVQGEGLRHLAALKQLRELNLTLTPVSDDALQHLAGLTELRILGLASTQCTGTGFAHLKGLKNLESVNFHFTPLNDAGLEAISQVPITDRLWFAHTRFTDAGAVHLKRLTQLKRCGIGSANKESSGEAVAALVNTPLEDLSLLDNQATSVGLAHAAKIATLKKLDASHAPTVTDESMLLVAKLPALEEFKLGSAKITDAGLQALAESKSLKKLSLSGLKNITPAGVEQLRKARPDLVIEVK